jgi:hypothetical protein
MHFHCSQHFWNTSSGMLFRIVFACLLMLATSDIHWPFKVVINFWNSQKMCWSKSGKYERWFSIVTDVLAKISEPTSTSWAGHCHDTRPKYHAKVQVFPTHIMYPFHYFQATQHLHCLTLFKTLQEQVPCDKKTAMSSFGLVTCMSF